MPDEEEMLGKWFFKIFKNSHSERDVEMLRSMSSSIRNSTSYQFDRNDMADLLLRCAEYFEKTSSTLDLQAGRVDRIREELDEVKIDLLEHSLHFLDYRTDVPAYFMFKNEVLGYADLLYSHNSEEYRRLIRLFESAKKKPLFSETNIAVVPEVRAIIRRAREILKLQH